MEGLTMENMNQTEVKTEQTPINNAQNAVQAPAAQLKTDRGLLKFILLSFITLGIYGLIVTAHISEDVNVVCSKYDGKKTMNYWLLIFLVGPFTLGIGYIVWMHKLCERIGKEADRRGLGCNFGAATFWLWNVLGTFILVGPFIFLHKLLSTVNAINQDYNQKG